MKKILYIMLPLAVIAVVVVKLKSNKEIVKEKVFQFDKNKPVQIEADTIKSELIGNEFSFSGTFEPNKESKLSYL